MTAIKKLSANSIALRKFDSQVTTTVTLSADNIWRDRPASVRPRGNHALDQFVGANGNGAELSWTTRRQIMAALRQSCRVLGAGQKSRIGRLGGGAALGALISGSFVVPAYAQYSAGGVTAAPTRRSGWRKCSQVFAPMRSTFRASATSTPN